MARAGIRPLRGARIPTTRVPGWMDPMLATLVTGLPDSGGWVFERKLDGVRAIAYRDGDHVRLFSRNKLPLEASYPEVVVALEKLAQTRFVLDGEVVAFVDGDPAGFEVLQQRPSLGARVKLRYFVFDVLSAAGTDVRALPLLERRRVMQEAFSLRGTLTKTAQRTGDAETLRLEACSAGWEGLIGKRVDSVYRGGRSRDWVKLKCVNEQEFVIAGFTDPKGSRTGFGALLIGYHGEDGLRFAGEVGTGFTERALRELSERLRARETTSSPFTDLPRARKGQNFVHPELVAQVGFTEWTRDGKLRHPRFLGLREDKSPDQVVRERPAR